MSNVPNLAKQYQRKTDKQHILDNPDTYIGSVENVDANMWIYDDQSERIVQKTIEYIPGLYKLNKASCMHTESSLIGSFSLLRDLNTVTNFSSSLRPFKHLKI